MTTTTNADTILTIVDLATYNGKLTITNPATSGHRTFGIRSIRNGNLQGKRIVELLTGPDNTSDYRAFGFVDDDGKVTVFKKHRGTDFEKMANILNNSDRFQESHGLIYQFAVKCRRCNRDLTDPESITLGIGPVCRKGGK